MDKYLTRPRNPRASAKQNSSDSTIQVCLADCDNHENYDSQKDYIQCAVGKDIRSFFAKPTIAKDNANSESPKSVRTSALDFKQLFKKSEEIDSDQIREKNDKKRQFPDSSDEEEANESILKIKFNWSKRQKIEQEVQNVEQLLPSRLLEEHLDTEADAETTPSNESRALDDLEPINQDVLMLEKPTEDDKIQSEIKQVGANNNEVQVVNVEAGVISLRRSSRRCSVPSRLGSMIMPENEAATSPPRDTKLSRVKTSKKSLKVSKQQPSDDNDDVIIVGVANSNILTTNNGKVMELAPMFRKQSKMSAEELERRKNFLMSGVPEEIRRQQVALQNQTASASQFAPFPRFGHVTQTSPEDEIESSNSILPLLPCSKMERKIQTPVSSFPKRLFGHLLSESEIERPRIRENLVGASPASGRSSDVSEKLLLEIKTSHLEFPVETIYQMLKTKQKCRPILSKNPTEILVSDDEEEDDEKEEVVEDDGHANEKITSKLYTEERNLLWTEKYAPTRTNEIVGNKAECKKVCDWLLDLKAKYSNSSEDKGSDSMDDFWTPGGMNDGDSNTTTFSSNALVIVGPHGIGKTALVYAVAQELGFKVFEVNPSSAREGRQVWSQLQEATQSHQLHTSRCQGSTNEEASIRGRKEDIPKTKAEGKPKSKSPRSKLIPPTFGSKVHLKTSNISKKKQIITMETIKKRKAPLKRNKFGRKSNQKKGVRNGYSSAAKTSLILFDEADVVFESDRGFWSAVQKFVKTTKRPIVLTVSDEDFIQKFGMNIEVVNMKRPYRALVSSYLRTMALAEGLRLDGEDVESLVESFNCDIRRCILQFQMMFSNKISSHLSTLRPICFSKSSLELNEMKDDWQGSETSAVSGCAALPSKPHVSKGEDSKPDKASSVKLALCQSSMTAYFNLARAPCADDDDDDDFVLSPATTRTRKINRIDSEDDIVQMDIKAEGHDNDGRATQGAKKNEYVTSDCDVPVFQIPRVFWGCSDVGPLRTARPPFYQHFTTSIQNYVNIFENSFPHGDESLSKVLPKSSVVPSESCNETDKEEDVRSLKLLSKMLDQVSLFEVTFRNRLEPSTPEVTFDLQFRKISKPLPGESDQFGFDERREAKLPFCQLEEDIRNSIVDMTSRQFSVQVLKNGKGLEQLLAKQDEDLLECQRRLTGVFQDRQSLMSDLRKSSIRNHTRWNPMPEILPMLITISKAENQRKINQSRRRFLHHLSYIYPNIHPDRFNFRM